jgi:hypothetical protein
VSLLYQLSGNSKADDATTNYEDISVNSGHNLSSNPISANLFCKRSQVAFKPSGLFCKMNVEHRTSNVQHRMKKQTPNTEHSTAISVSFQPF